MGSSVSEPLVILILGGLVWWVAGRTLRPVEEIRAEVASIGPKDLRRRVPEPTGGDEIASLAATMNLMLGRIEEAVARQQEFVADASHELRSPLTRMRSEIEVDLASGAALGRHRLESLRDEVEELQRLVEDLLLLARSDAGAGGFDALAVDLDDIVFEEGRMVRELGRVQVDMAAVSAAQVLGEKRQLRRAIHNLVDNAGRYAESRVELALAEVNGSAELVVANDGPGIPDEQVERIFERFMRVDDSRARHSGGSGLGMAIARSIARRHGGDLTLEPSIWAEARFVMRIPTP